MDKKLSTEILQGIEDEFLQTYENLLEVITQGEINYRDFEKKLKELLNELGCTILKQVLEKLDEKIRENKEERPDYWVERRDDEKIVLTVFGKVNYARTYYRNKHDGTCKHLVDEIAGYTLHMKVDPVVKGELLEHATEKSYEKATKALSLYDTGKKLSRQTVSNIVKSFDKPCTYKELEPKKEVPVVYIEADEDHLSVRGSKKLTEGHVSHVLSSRMSSRPMAWSKKGAEYMATLRTLKASSEDIQQLYLQDVL